ncbi:MAG: hypothetical protein ACPL1A_01210 [Candidatus Kapaibacteriota bacterium]
MKQHKLIFDYLDGEITPEDNKILREILNEDEELQQDFQNFVDINFEMKNDNENFNFPEEFLDSVGNSIREKMQADNDLSEQKKKRKKIYFQYSLVATFLIISGILLNLYQMKSPSLLIEKNMKNQGSETQPLILRSEKLTEGNIIHSSQKSVNEKKIISKENNANFSMAKSSLTLNHSNNNQIANSNPQIIANSNIANNSILGNNNPASPSTELTSNNITNDGTDIGKENRIIETNLGKNNSNSFNFRKDNSNIALNTISQNNLKNNNLNDLKANTNLNFDSNPFSNQIFPKYHSNTIVSSNSLLDLNSFFGYDLFAFGVTKKKQIINSFTQSVGAEIDNYSKVGLETGYMQFVTSEDKYIMINKGIEGGTLVKIENFDENNVLVRVEGTSLTNKDLFWAGIYYERSMFNFDNFILSSRISIGASDYGFLSSLKLLAKYKLTKSIDLTLGSDAKLFSGSGTNSTTKNNINSTISLIYGLRFAF